MYLVLFEIFYGHGKFKRKIYSKRIIETNFGFCLFIDTSLSMNMQIILRRCRRIRTDDDPWDCLF